MRRPTQGWMPETERETTGQETKTESELKRDPQTDRDMVGGM